MKTKTTGDLGEKYAVEYLKSKGYTVDLTNYHTRFGEIDIIAHNDEYLLFVEVKSRSGNFSKGREAVTSQKQKKLIMTAMIYLEQHQTNLQPRFDVIEILFKSKDNPSLLKLCHIKNAFEAGNCYELF